MFSEPIVDLLFGRGAFTAEAVRMTSGALRGYAVGLVAFGQREILSRAFYAIQDTKTPMINGMIAVGANVVLNLIFSRYLGIGGLALATSIAAIISVILLAFNLSRKIGDFGIRVVLVTLFKITVASVAMGFIAHELYRYFQIVFSPHLALVLAIGVNGHLRIPIFGHEISSR